MRKRIEMSRLSLHIPTTLYKRIDDDSKAYGITKTALLQTMIVNYYRAVDVPGGKPFMAGAHVKGQAAAGGETP